MRRLFREKLDAFGLTLTDEREKAIFARPAPAPRRGRRRSRSPTWARASASPASGPARSRPSSPSRLRDFVKAEIPDFDLLGPD